MGLVDRIERKLESTVGDAFARVFGGSIVPQEVEALLRREAEAGIRPVGRNRVLAPNEYVITLSVPDHKKVSADPDLTATTFAKHLEDTSVSRGGKRMVMWSSNSSSHRICTLDSSALVVRSTPTPPLANPPQHTETMRSPQNQEYDR